MRTDKKLLTLIVNALFAVALYFSTKYLAPTAIEDVKFLIAILQPIVALWLGLETFTETRSNRQELLLLRSVLAKKVADG